MHYTDGTSSVLAVQNHILNGLSMKEIGNVAFSDVGDLAWKEVDFYRFGINVDTEYISLPSGQNTIEFDLSLQLKPPTGGGGPGGGGGG